MFKHSTLIDLFKRREAISVLLILVFLLIMLTTLFLNPQLYEGSAHEGDIALNDIYAPYDFAYVWGVDQEKTAIAQQDAVRNTPYYFRRDDEVEKEIKKTIEAIFTAIEVDKAQKDMPFEKKLADLKDKIKIAVPEKNYKVLLDREGELSGVKDETLKMVGNMLNTGLINDESEALLSKDSVKKVIICVTDQSKNSDMETKDLLPVKNIAAFVETYSQNFFGEDKSTRQAAAAIATAAFKANLVFDDRRTNEEKENVKQRTSAIPQTLYVKKNEIIVEKGQRVEARHVAELTKLKNLMEEEKSRGFLLGMVLLFLVMGVIGTVYLAIMKEKNLLKNPKDLAIIFLNMVIMLVMSNFFIRLPHPSYFIPLAGMSMMIMLLVDFNTAFLCTMIIGFVISVMTSGGVGIAVVLITGSVVAMYFAKGARRRAEILWAGLMAGFVNVFTIVAFGMINDVEMAQNLRDALWGVANGVLSGIVVMVLLPVFEYVFKVPTNISLLEMSDLNHPLLRRLAVEAPGTYHHSIMVGNLAEAACDAISANNLLARVGAYYHDIGKLAKPQYYSENEMGEKSKHSNLAPSMSALVISKHVKEGVDLAEKFKLNNTIIDFIKQHHGTSLIWFFYQKALEKSSEDVVLDQDDFRYPGPKPQTKEAAIVMLADSVEASSRSLHDPTPASVRNLVKRVINNKFIDGQFDECELTLKDINKISDAFVRVLAGVFHTRVNYPDKDITPAGGSKINGKSKLPKQKS